MENQDLGDYYNRDKQEYILCAAIWFDDGIKREHEVTNIETGFVVCGRRHHNCFSLLYHLSNKDTSYLKLEKEQGFITSKNRFVDRYEAMKIAHAANQTNKTEGQLFSEDLY